MDDKKEIFLENESFVENTDDSKIATESEKNTKVEDENKSILEENSEDKEQKIEASKAYLERLKDSNLSEDIVVDTVTGEIPVIKSKKDDLSENEENFEEDDEDVKIENHNQFIEKDDSENVKKHLKSKRKYRISLKENPSFVSREKIDAKELIKKALLEDETSFVVNDVSELEALYQSTDDLGIEFELVDDEIENEESESAKNTDDNDKNHKISSLAELIENNDHYIVFSTSDTSQNENFDRAALQELAKKVNSSFAKKSEVKPENHKKHKEKKIKDEDLLKALEQVKKVEVIESSFEEALAENEEEKKRSKRNSLAFSDRANERAERQKREDDIFANAIKPIEVVYENEDGTFSSTESENSDVVANENSDNFLANNNIGSENERYNFVKKQEIKSTFNKIDTDKNKALLNEEQKQEVKKMMNMMMVNSGIKECNSMIQKGEGKLFENYKELFSAWDDFSKDE